MIAIVVLNRGTSLYYIQNFLVRRILEQVGIILRHISYILYYSISDIRQLIDLYLIYPTLLNYTNIALNRVYICTHIHNLYISLNTQLTLIIEPSTSLLIRQSFSDIKAAKEAIKHLLAKAQELQKTIYSNKTGFNIIYIDI